MKKDTISAPKQATIYIKDEINCVISGLSKGDNKFFYDELGIFTDGHFFNHKFKAGLWDGKAHFYSKTGVTYVKLLDIIIPHLVAFGYKINLLDKRTAPSVDNFPIIDEMYFNHVWDERGGKNYVLEDHQVKAVNLAIDNGGGIIEASTGAGKTIICASISRLYNEHAGWKTITIVPNTNLVDQTKKQFQIMGLDVSSFDGRSKKLSNNVISTWQTLNHNPEILKLFNVIIVDECHTTQAKCLFDLIRSTGSNATVVIGVTGSIPKGEVNSTMLKAALGDVIYQIPAHVLIQKGWLATPNITIYQVKDWDVVDEEHPIKKIKNYEYALETNYLRTDVNRNDVIVDLIMEKSESGNALILVGSVPYGKKLAKMIPGAYFVHGKDDIEVRQKVYDLFETMDGIKVVATIQVAGVGISIDRIFNLFCVDLGKSFVKIIQAIGRGLRKGRDKDSVNVHDICSDLKYSKKHLTERVKYYREAKYQYTKIIIPLEKKYVDNE